MQSGDRQNQLPHVPLRPPLSFGEIILAEVTSTVVFSLLISMATSSWASSSEEFLPIALICVWLFDIMKTHLLGTGRCEQTDIAQNLMAELRVKNALSLS